MYILIKLVKIGSKDATDIQKHSARAQLSRKMVNVLTTIFIIGAIFFAKSFLRAFDCISDGTTSTRVYMQSSPEIECSVDDEESQYVAIVKWSQLGLGLFAATTFTLCLGLILAHRSDNPGLGRLCATYPHQPLKPNLLTDIYVSRAGASCRRSTSTSTFTGRWSY